MLKFYASQPLGNRIGIGGWLPAQAAAIQQISEAILWKHVLRNTKHEASGLCMALGNTLSRADLTGLTGNDSLKCGDVWLSWILWGRNRNRCQSPIGDMTGPNTDDKTIRCFGWRVFFKAVVPRNAKSFLSLVQEHWPLGSVRFKCDRRYYNAVLSWNCGPSESTRLWQHRSTTMN